jgi:hypothetical protein
MWGHLTEELIDLFARQKHTFPKLSGSGRLRLADSPFNLGKSHKRLLLRAFGVFDSF